MADLKTSLKQAWLKTMETVGNAASNIASTTRQRLDEMNLINRRREILSNLGNHAYEMWQKGVSLPSPLKELLEELSQVDEELNTLRAEKLAGLNTAETKSDTETKPEETTSGEDEKPVGVVYMAPTMDVPADEPVREPAKPLEDSIDDLINGVAKEVDHLVDTKTEEAGAKMQGVLDAIGTHVEEFAQELGQSIESLEKEINGAAQELGDQDDDHPNKG